LPKAIELMKKREKELLVAVKMLSDGTEGFTNPKLILIGGYALRAFIPFSRFTRDCDFIVRKKDGWHLDKLKLILPKDYSIEAEERHKSYGFMRWVKYVRYNETRVKVSLDFMEGEIRGRKPEEVILIDEAMVEKSEPARIPIANEEVKFFVPSYVDYFIMKVVSSRASDIRDIASLVLEKGVPRGAMERAKEILLHPEVFKNKLEEKVLPEIRRETFLDSWRGMFATRSYTNDDKEEVMERLKELIAS